MGDVHLEPGVPLQLLLLHERGSVRAEMECTARGTIRGRDGRSNATVRLELLWVVDDNFLVDLDRAREISEGLVREGATFRWSIQATTNLTSRLSVEDLKLLRRAGFQQICHGAESGSQKMLKLMNKGFQNFETIYETARRCLAADIRPSFNIIFAYPGEGPSERRQTH